MFAFFMLCLRDALSSRSVWIRSPKAIERRIAAKAEPICNPLNPMDVKGMIPLAVNAKETAPTKKSVQDTMKMRAGLNSVLSKIQAARTIISGEKIPAITKKVFTDFAGQYYYDNLLNKLKNTE
jgi:hypothetical protein